MKDDSLEALLSELSRIRSAEAVQRRLEKIATADPVNSDMVWQASFTRRAALPYVKGDPAPIGSLDYPEAFKQFKALWDGFKTQDSHDQAGQP